MGYQLWTSPVTGYRRKGTRLRELKHLFEDGITAQAILEPIQSCESGANAVDIARLLHEKDFDVVGVQERSEGDVIGFATREALQKDLVRDHVQRITAAHLISDATPLASLLSIFKNREFSFVLVGQHVRGIITRADLNKPPVRVYLFGLLSLLEMHLTFWLMIYYPNDGWKGSISQNRVDKATKLLEDRQARKLQMDLVDCLQFCDKRDLVLACEDLRKSLGLGEAKAAKSYLLQAEQLRDLLAHSQNDLSEGARWENLIEVVEWVEELVNKSDALVEERAKSTGGKQDPRVA